MSEGATPFVTVSLGAKGEEIATNLPPGQRPLMLWLLEKAKWIILTQLSEQEKSPLVKPNGLLKRMGAG